MGVNNIITYLQLVVWICAARWRSVSRPLCSINWSDSLWRQCRAGVGTRLTRLSDAVVCTVTLQSTCRKGHLSEMELCRFRNLTLNPTLTLALTLSLTLCLYVSDKWPFWQNNDPSDNWIVPVSLSWYVFCRLVVLVKLSLLAKWSARNFSTEA